MSKLFLQALKRINYTMLLLCLGERNVKYKEFKKREETMDGRFLCVIFEAVECIACLVLHLEMFTHLIIIFLIKYMFMEMGSCYVST